MGCCNAGKSFVENSIKDFWNQNPIVDLTITKYLDIMEKSTAYKKDIRTTKGFKENILKQMFVMELSTDQNEYMINNYLDINSKYGFCVPFALMLLMQSKNHQQLGEIYSKIFCIVGGRVENPRKVRNNMRGLKEILKFYVLLISLNSFDTIVHQSVKEEEENLKIFRKIYSFQSIERNLNNLFNFEFKAEDVRQEEVKKEDYQNLFDVKCPEEVLYFFKINMKNFNPDLIRDKLFDFEEKNANSNPIGEEKIERKSNTKRKENDLENLSEEEKEKIIQRNTITEKPDISEGKNLYQH
jgi:hypothetical protein